MEMSDIEKIIDSIKDKALDDVKKEFKDLLSKGRKDNVDFIREVAANTTRWLTMKAEGQLTEGEARTLLKSQKKLAQIFVNTQAIKTRARIQKLSYRLLDISIDVLVAAI
jgi:ribulose bisphosphate carboxylase small subunit